jgi:signal transduction histidine kinase
MRESVRQAARATVYLGLAVALAFGSYLFITVLLITIVGTVAVVGAGLLPETVLLIRRMAGAKRRHVAAWTGREIPEAYRPITGGLRESLRTAVRDPGTYGDLRWMIAYYGYGALGYLALPLWPAGLVVDGVWCGLLGREAVVLPLISRLADLDAAWSAALLRPSPQALLAERVQELTRTRADAIAAHSAELRRIERDLHDGAQARLVALGMSLRAAERMFASNPQAALALVTEARETSSRALTDLRDLVRGIYPPVLADRGLADAVRALALDTPLHTQLDVDLPAEVEMPVGAAVYFAVAEVLANAVRHSGARTVRISLSHAAGTLRAVVTDDGAGGADPAQGTGLAGVERRLATFDGILALNSPPGGPTIVVIEVPCALSSAKISSC